MWFLFLDWQSYLRYDSIVVWKSLTSILWKSVLSAFFEDILFLLIWVNWDSNMSNFSEEGGVYCFEFYSPSEFLLLPNFWLVFILYIFSFVFFFHFVVYWSCFYWIFNHCQLNTFCALQYANFCTIVDLGSYIVLSSNHIVFSIKINFVWVYKNHNL